MCTLHYPARAVILTFELGSVNPMKFCVGEFFGGIIPRNMSPEIKLTREMVQGVRDEVRTSFESEGKEIGKGEFENAVFETLAERLGLPLRDIGVAVVPDWKHPDVKEFSRQLREFKFEADLPETKQIKELRVPYPGIPESEFPTVRYATSLPNFGVLANITDFDAAFNNRPGYFFAVLIDKEGKKEVIFFGQQSHDKIREALERTNEEELKGSEWNYAQIGLDKTTGQLDNIMLKSNWGQDNKTRMTNVTALLGKINPDLFPSGTQMVFDAWGDFKAFYEPSTNELSEEISLQPGIKVPRLY